MRITELNPGDVRRAFYRALGYFPVTIEGRRYKCDTAHMGFWRWVEDGGWEPQTYKVLSTFLNPQEDYADIGSWIGPTAVYAASRCRRMFCFEPDTTALEYLLFNLRRNGAGNCTVFSCALSDSDGFTEMASFGSALGDSMTSLLNKDAAKGKLLVPCVSWASFEKMFGAFSPGFIKMDIEGGEFALIPAMSEFLKKRKPVLYLSIHPGYCEASRRASVVESLFDALSFYHCIMTDRFEKTSLSRILRRADFAQSSAYILKAEAD